MKKRRFINFFLGLLLVSVFSFSAINLTGCGASSTSDSVNKNSSEDSSNNQVASGLVYTLTYEMANPETHSEVPRITWDNTYIGGSGQNKTENGGIGYNTLSHGSVSAGGIMSGKTILELIDGNKYKLTKSLTYTAAGVEIVYSFEGSIESNSDNVVMLGAPTFGTAHEALSAGFINNGIKPNYADETTSNVDARILKWFNTAYISYAESSVAEAVTINNNGMTLAYKETAGADTEEPTKEPDGVIVTKTQTVKSSTGADVEVTTTFKADGTYSGTSGASGKWFVKDGAVVAENGTWDAATSTLTVTWYGGKARLAVELSADELATMSVVTTAFIVVEKTQTVKSSTGADVEVTTTFKADGTYSGTSGASGKWFVKDGAVVAENGTWDAATSTLTVTWYGGKARLAIELSADDLSKMAFVTGNVEE